MIFAILFTLPIIISAIVFMWYSFSFNLADAFKLHFIVLGSFLVCWSILLGLITSRWL